MTDTLADAPALDLGLDWRDGFTRLGPSFHTPLPPTPLPAPHLVGLSERLARELGLDPDTLRGEDAVQAFTGNLPLAGTRPVATVYSGHQFGVWAGQLGDGRAILLGEADTPAGPQEFQLKGAGRTPYSRMGDGRAVLRSSIREFLASEAMAALGIPTTRALMVTGSPAPVRRETIETAAVVTRVAPSFIRFGHFEHFAAAGRDAELRALADHVIDRWYPQCRGTGRFGGNAYAAFLEQVSERTAAMVAQWQAAGFCHGVMNTDNMSILGLTLDYGPFQFLDAFDPGHICNHSDTGGRYAYNRQPNVAYWNLFCLGQALLPVIDDPDLALAALESYKTVFPRELLARMGAKLGLSAPRETDRALVDGVLHLLAEGRIDYPIFWRRLADHVAGGPLAPVRDLFPDRDAFDRWHAAYAARLAEEAGEAGARMRATNPKYVLRNLLGELAIQAAQSGDFSVVDRLLALLQDPFAEHPALEADYAGFPPDWASSIEISCSS
ncbi:protein adenylyltransferase SelO [Ramlibacter sp. MAHUQ-53]|uniref:protein adenylyltransferase SelO n=1 Tax=unclassified Ramlibacter TaxID=2617605 RepID=UPI0036291BBF